MLKKILGGLFGIVILGAIGLWAFWPKGLVVNGPLLDFLTGRQAETPTADVLQDRFKLPEGFRIGIFASDINNARTLAVTSAGDVLVTSMRPGEVILLHRDENGDGAADGRSVIASGLDWPHSIALHNGYLYIAETTQIVRGRFDPLARQIGDLEVVFDGMPPGGNHRTRSIGFDPDGALYVTVGSSCNVCIEEEPYRATMLQMNADGTAMKTYATGLRNSVGFDWRPETGGLYATDNGRDLLGDNTPHCELNLVEGGSDYGWPWAYDDQQPDPDFGPGNADKVAASKPLLHGFGAHTAPLGIRFFDPATAPAGYKDAALVALHGSWNRSELAGYKVVSLHFDGDAVNQRDFLTGFELNEDVIGRPVEMAFGPDGAIYLSDDYAGVVYKIGFGNIAVPGFALEARQLLDPLAELDAMTVAELSGTGVGLYSDYGCASCHDPEAAADGVQVKELQALASRYTIDDLKGLFAAPPGPMPAFEFSDMEAQALAVYLLSEFGD